MFVCLCLFCFVLLGELRLKKEAISKGLRNYGKKKVQNQVKIIELYFTGT